jgi:putative transcriptional regulator
MNEESNKAELLIRLGSHIAKVRTEKGLSGAELARRCFLDRQAIDRIERGKTNPTFLTLMKIAEALEISLEELVLGSGL